VKLPGAEWKNPEQLADWSAKLPKEKEIIIYCARGGSVSNAVLDTLLSKGSKARFIEGDINWNHCHYEMGHTRTSQDRSHRLSVADRAFHR
jgi:rhodanese-related sulfurtransferase